MSLTYDSHFEKSCQSVYDKVQKKRVTVCDPLYSAEQWAALEQAIQTALGDDFISFEWVDEPTKQSFSVAFHGDFSEELQMEVPTAQLPIIDAAVQAWYEETL